MAKKTPEELDEETRVAAQVAATEAGRSGVVIDPPKAAKPADEDGKDD